MPDIFISYSRRNSEFVHKLVDALRAKGRDVWVDFEDIPFSADWWEEIVEGIQAATAAIFCISPDSIKSEICALEVTQIMQNRKKLVPIVVQEPGDDIRLLSDTIRRLNWIFFDEPEKFGESLKHLLEAIDTDLEVEKERTRLLIRAREWENNAYPNSMLLRGEELNTLLPLIHDNLIPLQQTFLQKSERQEVNRQQLWHFASGLLGGILSMGFYTSSNLIGDQFVQPQVLALTIGAGIFFGFFVGIVALFGHDVILQIRDHIPQWSHLPVQIITTFASGMLAWFMFQSVLLQFWPGLTWTNVFGGIGLATGFLVNGLLRPPPIVTIIIAFIGIYLPIWALNNHGIIHPDPALIYFDFAKPQDMYVIGIPMALLLAVGPNLYALWGQLRGSRVQLQKRKRKLEMV